MHSRIREVRKALKLNQKEFGLRLGLTQVHISGIENNRSVLIEKNIKLICKTFNVNETWLRTGVGDMFCDSPREVEFQEIFNKLTADTQKSLILIVRELVNIEENLLKKSSHTMD